MHVYNVYNCETNHNFVQLMEKRRHNNEDTQRHSKPFYNSLTLTLRGNSPQNKFFSINPGADPGGAPGARPP